MSSWRNDASSTQRDAGTGLRSASSSDAARVAPRSKHAAARDAAQSQRTSAAITSSAATNAESTTMTPPSTA